MKTINSLERAVTEFISYIHSLSDEQCKFSSTSRYGPREVLIHLTYWHEQYVAITTALIAHQEPKLVTGSFKDANARAQLILHDIPVAILIKRLHNAQNLLSRMYPEAQVYHIAFKEGGTLRPYPAAIELIARHIRSHLRQVQRS